MGMQARVEHEFAGEENQALTRLSEGLSRFSVMTGVVGMALVALGIAAIVTKGYGSPLAGPAIVVLGLVAMLGGALFLRPRVSLNAITRSRGRDITRLMDALTFLDAAHGVFRILIAAFVVARLVSFLLIRLA
jgi:hypothetical protein